MRGWARDSCREVPNLGELTQCFSWYQCLYPTLRSERGPVVGKLKIPSWAQFPF